MEVTLSVLVLFFAGWSFYWYLKAESLYEKYAPKEKKHKRDLDDAIGVGDDGELVYTDDSREATKDFSP